ncbi:hypothetical protein NIES4071_55730 [Calothrix sp. NIES-4071]|nr:hypothetical protein NIES4071_55730 [Calothrix sp. NIES-4071]BAZ59880.1 hypothetical protein NIES4105_55680 [Calothrix sp. NIES-4105]
MTQCSTSSSSHPAQPNPMLKQLVAQACQYPPGSMGRQEKLNQIIFEIQSSKKIWIDSRIYHEDYEDALQTAWINFCQKISDYDPTKGEVIDWFNGILKNKLKNAYSQIKKEQSRRVIPPDDGSDPIGILPDSKTSSPMLEDTLEWIERDGESLSKLHVRNCPNINCKMLLLRRLPPEETTWENLAKEFSTSIGTITSFYQRKCYPCLLAFAKEQGYINP